MINATTYKAHPYAEAWPMLGDEELAELAEDITENGLRDSIVLFEGKILDGRNRYAACQEVGVEPHFVEFEGNDDDALSFVQSVNNARRHQSKGSLVASWALSMLAARKRQDGKWLFRKRQNSDALDRESRRVCGVIADYSADLLLEVRNDSMTLNAALQQAEQRRDAERQRLEEQKRLEAEEADSRAFVEENAPDLAAQVGDVFQSFVEAHDVWKRRNREEAERIRREKAAKERAERERRQSLTEMFSNGIGKALMTLGSYGQRENPADVMAEFSDDLLDPPQLKRNYSPDNIRAAQRFLDALLEWSTK